MSKTLTWAVNEGERRNLTRDARLLLVVLVQMANNATGESNGGQVCLRRKTGIPLRSLFEAMQSLIAEGLVTRTKKHKSWLHKVVAPAFAEPKSSATDADKSAPTSPKSSATDADLEAMSSALDADKAAEISAMVADDISAGDADEPISSAKSAPLIGKGAQKSSAPGADRTYLRELTERELCAGAREAARSPDGGGLTLRAEEDAAPTPEPQARPEPTAVPKAPVIGGTPAGSGPVPGGIQRPDPFDDAGEDNAGYIARLISGRRAAALAIAKPRPIYASHEVLKAHRDDLARRAAAAAGRAS